MFASGPGPGRDRWASVLPPAILLRSLALTAARLPFHSDYTTTELLQKSIHQQFTLPPEVLTCISGVRDWRNHAHTVGAHALSAVRHDAARRACTITSLLYHVIKVGGVNVVSEELHEAIV